MITKAAIDEFFAQRTLAVVGVSRQDKKFGNTVFRALRENGYQVFPINPLMETIDGEPCFPSLSAIPEPLGGAIIVVPPIATELVVQDAERAGINRLWLQPGSESTKAIQFCQDKNITVIYGYCPMMFLKQTAFIHRFHGWILRLVGKLPR